MTPWRSPHGRLAGLTLLAALACGGTDDGGEERFPSRDWSGVYSLRAVGSSTDCAGAETPPPLGDLALEVRQTVDNEVSVWIGPLVSLTGRLEGDELEAAGEISQPISLPESLASRASLADSLETIAYRLEAAFAGESLRGRYVIRAPDLVALARGAEKRRCSYEYEVRGVPLIAVPSPDSLPTGG